MQLYSRVRKLDQSIQTWAASCTVPAIYALQTQKSLGLATHSRISMLWKLHYIEDVDFGSPYLYSLRILCAKRIASSSSGTFVTPRELSIEEVKHYPSSSWGRSVFGRQYQRRSFVQRNVLRVISVTTAYTVVLETMQKFSHLGKIAFSYRQRKPEICLFVHAVPFEQSLISTEFVNTLTTSTSEKLPEVANMKRCAARCPPAAQIRS